MRVDTTLTATTKYFATTRRVRFHGDAYAFTLVSCVLYPPRGDRPRMYYLVLLLLFFAPCTVSYSHRRVVIIVVVSLLSGCILSLRRVIIIIVVSLLSVIIADLVQKGRTCTDSYVDSHWSQLAIVGDGGGGVASSIRCCWIYRLSRWLTWVFCTCV